MKANLSLTNFHNNRFRSKMSCDAGAPHERNTVQKCEKINLENKPADSVNFCGSIFHKSIDDVYKSIAGNTKIEKFAKKANDNPVVMEAIMSLGLVGIVRSLIVMVTPGTDKEDKKTMVAKNVISAVIGYVTSLAIFGPLSRASKKVLSEPQKYLKNEKLIRGLTTASAESKKYWDNPELFKEGSEETKVLVESIKNSNKLRTGFETLWKKSPDVPFSVAKSAMTVALIPIITKLIFGSKKDKKENELNQEILINNILNNNITKSMNKTGGVS